jgi:signal transduction histidine kinase
VGIGVLNIRRAEVRPFSDKQIELLKTFADQAVIAIENVRLFNETREALQRQTATSEILEVISRSQDNIQPVFDMIAASALKLCEAGFSFVARYDGDLIHLAALSNIDVQGAAAIRDAWPAKPGSGSATGRAIAEQRVIHIADVADDPHYTLTSAAHSIGYRSVLAVPMLKEGTPIGALGVARMRPGVFSEQHIGLLKTFADQAVIAIENVRLFNETKEAFDHQKASAEVLGVISSSVADTQPVFDKILESCQRLFAGLNVGINVVREDGLVHLAAFAGPARAELESHFPVPLSAESGSGAAIIARRIVHYPDSEAGGDVPDYVRRGSRIAGNKSVIFAPILWEGKGIGAIHVGRKFAGSFSAKEISLLGHFADQTAIAIQNARLFKQLEERNKALSEALEHQTATSEVLQAISRASFDLDGVLSMLLEAAMRLCYAQHGGMYRLEGEAYRCVAVHGLNASYESIERESRIYPDRGTIVGRAVLERRPVQIEDAMTDLDYLPREEAKIGGLHTMLGVPLVREGIVIGVFALARSRIEAFSPKQVDLVRTFADQAIIAIENVRLFRELEARTVQLAHSVDQLRALTEVSQAVNSTLDLQEVLSTIVSRAVQLSSTNMGAVYELDEGGRELQLRTTYGIAPDLVDAMLAKSLPVGEGATGRAVQQRTPMEITDMTDTDAYRGHLRQVIERAEVRSILAVPLLREGEVLGALTVSRKVAGRVAAEVVATLQTFAAQSAVAIQNARLFREIEHKSRELQIASQHKSQFLANMSHELRTPLNAILGYTELIVDQIYGEVPSRIMEVLERVQKSGRHLLGLINDVLDLSKIEAGQLSLSLSDYSFNDAAQSVVSAVESLAAEKGLKLSVDVPRNLPVGRGDERRIVQVLLNLVGNAIKFTESGEVALKVRTKQEKFLVSVSDTGPGIAEHDRARIFEEFQQVDASSTREKGGTGLGLAIARRIVEMHGGSIWVESTVGQGSTFSFSIPVQTAQKEVVQ